MPLPEVADDRLPVLEGQVQSFDSWDIWSTSWAVDPGSAMLVDEQIAMEVLESNLVVQIQGRWPLRGHAESLDELQIRVLVLG